MERAIRFDEIVRSESDVESKVPPKLSGEDANPPKLPKSAIPKKDEEIPVDYEAYEAAGEKRYDHSDEAVEKTFATYGFTKAMIAGARKIITSETAQVFSLLDNSSDMSKGDGFRVEATTSMGATVTGLALQELLIKEASGEGTKRRNSRIGGYALSVDALNDDTLAEAKTDPAVAIKARETAARAIGVRTEGCARWDELTEETTFQIDVAAMMKKPTEFQLISIPSKGVSRKFGVATDEGDDDCFMETEPAAGDVKAAQRGRKSMSTGRNTVFAGGGNFILSLEEEAGLARDAIDDLNGNLKGLPRSIIGLLKEIKKALEEFQDTLKDHGKKALVTIITGAYPWGSSAASDQKNKFMDLVASLKGLSVTLVFSVKSCDKPILNFYEELVSHGKNNEVDVHAIKSFEKMYVGVSFYNQWLNYCPPIHLSQLLGGAHQHLLFYASCRELTLSEAGELCHALLGEYGGSNLLNPTVEGLDEYVAALQAALEEEPVQWHAKDEKMAPIINKVKFKAAYSGERKKKKTPANQPKPTPSTAHLETIPRRESSSCCVVM